MTKFTPNQIGVLLYGVNWGPSSPGPNDANTIAFLDTAIAVCHGESGWDSNAVNGAMIGLWQINTNVHKNYTREELLSPHTNTLQARDIYHAAKGWTPWEAWTTKSPAYRAGLGHGKAVHDYLRKLGDAGIKQEYLNISQVDTGQVIGGDVFGGIGGIGQGLVSGTSDLGSKVFDFIKKAAVPIGVFTLGAILLILGVVFLIVNSKAGKAVVNNTPVGVVKKALK